MICVSGLICVNLICQVRNVVGYEQPGLEEVTGAQKKFGAPAGALNHGGGQTFPQTKTRGFYSDESSEGLGFYGLWPYAVIYCRDRD